MVTVPTGAAGGSFMRCRPPGTSTALMSGREARSQQAEGLVVGHPTSDAPGKDPDYALLALACGHLPQVWVLLGAGRTSVHFAPGTHLIPASKLPVRLLRRDTP